MQFLSLKTYNGRSYKQRRNKNIRQRGRVTAADHAGIRHWLVIEVTRWQVRHGLARFAKRRRTFRLYPGEDCDTILFTIEARGACGVDLGLDAGGALSRAQLNRISSRLVNCLHCITAKTEGT